MMAVTPNSRAEQQTIGVILAERIYAGLIVGHKLSGKLRCWPAEPNTQDSEDENSMVELPADALVQEICKLIIEIIETTEGVAGKLTAVGVALPGLVRQGVVEEAPNLPQLKGVRMVDMLATCLAEHGITVPISVVNDADAMAAGLASEHGKLDSFIRVWSIGTGVGYGAYPFTEGVWEGGHSVVTLEDKENYCGCGGRGHLEGIMGHRAMRLRFLDMEPEEVFAAANRKSPDLRCLEFKKLWHKALAAATASSIHFSGAGRFYLTGYNMRFLDLNMLKDYLHQMVKMSPLQSYMLEVVADDETTRVVGAAVAAEQAVGH
jgi:predicted NBD/HSP70 family sugar kinase